MNSFLATRTAHSLASPHSPGHFPAQTCSSVSSVHSGLPQPSKLTLASFTLLSIIGEGGYSLVYLAQEKTSGCPVALKQIAKAELNSSKLVGRVYTEKDILSKISHPLIVGYLGCFQDPENLYIALEFVQGGDLYSWLMKRVRLETSEIRFYAAEIASVLLYLHRQNLIYRDLKAENILICTNGHVKLTDFGLAKRLLPGERTHSLCGTPHCMAPEIITKSGHGCEVDWWSFGILLHEMVTGHSPFDAASSYDVYSNIITRQYRPPEDSDPAISTLLVGLLEKDAGRRLKGEEVLSHQLFKDIDWGNLSSLRPPYIPVIKGPLDICHFDHYDSNGQTEGSSQTAAVDQSQFAGF